MAGAAIQTPIHAHTGPINTLTGLPIQTQRDPDTDSDGTARGTADVGNYGFSHYQYSGGFFLVYFTAGVSKGERKEGGAKESGGSLPVLVNTPLGVCV